MSEALDKARRAKAVAGLVGKASSSIRSDAIRAAAEELYAREDAILAANKRDYEAAQADGMSESLLDRLLLTHERIEAMAHGLCEIADQADPLNRVVAGHRAPNGMDISCVTVPLGVVGMIYEARPNVTVDAFALCIRSGNACVLKGGSAARLSCQALVEACRAALTCVGLPQDACQYIDDDAQHTQTDALIQARGIVDVVIPRGSSRLIQYCVQHALVPTIETGVGNCHIYLHRDADPQMSVAIALNAKTQRTGVCNAAESLLYDNDTPQELVREVLSALASRGVTLRGDSHTQELVQGSDIPIEPACEEDFATEYLALCMSVACVEDIDAAIAHINRYGTGHSEAIVTRNYAAAEQFLNEVDASAVYVNCSTRFTDGGVFGKGGEIGISTQKLHARGPMGAEALTSTKWIIRGNGCIR